MQIRNTQLGRLASSCIGMRDPIVSVILLFPGQKGTKRLVEQYGDALLCVRYRTDEKRGLRLKTVELIVGEKPLRTGSKYQDEEMVNLIVAYGETILRDQLKSLGGRWNPKDKLWQVEFGAIRGIPELVERIVQPETSTLHGL